MTEGRTMTAELPHHPTEAETFRHIVEQLRLLAEQVHHQRITSNHQTRLLERIMAAVQVEQTELNDFATAVEAAVGSVRTELADLEAKIAANQPLAAGDLSSLRTALTDLEGLEAPAVTPVPAPPAGDTPPAGDVPPAGA